jgi:hypothetical protein
MILFQSLFLELPSSLPVSFLLSAGGNPVREEGKLVRRRIGACPPAVRKAGCEQEESTLRFTYRLVS